MHRTHIDIFGGWAPASFVNQDADPFIFQVYRRWGAARFAPTATISNGFGGDVSSDTPPRYDAVHIDWTHEILQQGVASAEAFLQNFFKLSKKPLPPRYVTLDVIVPSFRAPLDILGRIVALEVPPRCSTQVIIIIDDPRHRAVRHLLEEEFGERVRVRVNESNRGASFSRSRGLDESCADWVLFIDDDVTPNADILSAYAEAIASRGQGAAGFVAPTSMPPPPTVWAAGIALASLLYFWDRNVQLHEETPWGVTAQLCARRTRVRFDEDFPKTGGGEDIDFILRGQRAMARPLLTLSTEGEACLHPWWDAGAPNGARFFGWATGDSLLLDKYPEYRYLSFPNVVECSAAALLLLFLLLIFLFLFLLLLAPSTIATTSTFSTSAAPSAAAPAPSALYAALTHVGGVGGAWAWAAWGAGGCLAFVALAWLAETVLDVLASIRSNEAPSFHGLRRFAAAVIGSVYYKNLHTEAGHLLAPIRRGTWRHVTHRWDWWCGTSPEMVSETRAREAFRFAIFTLAAFFAATSPGAAFAVGFGGMAVLVGGAWCVARVERLSHRVSDPA